MIVVTNGSRRPVRDVASKIKAIQAATDTQHEKLADVWGAMERLRYREHRPGRGVRFRGAIGQSAGAEGRREDRVRLGLPSRGVPALHLKGQVH